MHTWRWRWRGTVPPPVMSDQPMCKGKRRRRGGGCGAMKRGKLLLWPERLSAQMPSPCHLLPSPCRMCHVPHLHASGAWLTNSWAYWITGAAGSAEARGALFATAGAHAEAAGKRLPRASFASASFLPNLRRVASAHRHHELMASSLCPLALYSRSVA